MKRIIMMIMLSAGMAMSTTFVFAQSEEGPKLEVDDVTNEGDVQSEELKADELEPDALQSGDATTEDPGGQQPGSDDLETEQLPSDDSTGFEESPEESSEEKQAEDRKDESDKDKGSEDEQAEDSAKSKEGESSAESDLEILRDQLATNRKELVSANIDLTEDEAKKFWPVYDDYRDEIKKVNERAVDVIKDYADNYESMSDKKAAELMTKAMDIEEDRMIYKQIYVDDLKQIFPTTKVARLYQIENKIDTAVKAELIQQIPLVLVSEDKADDKK